MARKYEYIDISLHFFYILKLRRIDPDSAIST